MALEKAAGSGVRQPGFNPDSMLASYITSRSLPFLKHKTKIITLPTAKCSLMPQRAMYSKHQSQCWHTENATIHNDVNSNDKQLCLPTNSNLSPFSYVFYIQKHCDFSFDVGCHPSWCNSLTRHN